MITLVLESRVIPDGTTVRKVTGQQTYTLQRAVKIYMPDDTRMITTEGIVFLLGERAINGYPDTIKFAVDFSDEHAAIEFLQEITEARNAK